MFENVKVGDLVVVNGFVETVTKVTSKRFCAGDAVFLKENGREFGKSDFYVIKTARKPEGELFKQAYKNTQLKKSIDLINELESMLVYLRKFHTAHISTEQSDCALNDIEKCHQSVKTTFSKLKRN